MDAIISVALAKKEGVLVNLTIVGGGDADDIAELNNTVAKFDVSEQVEYIGHISSPETLSGYYKQADVFLYPSYYPEGFPRVVYEAIYLACRQYARYCQV